MPCARTRHKPIGRWLAGCFLRRIVCGNTVISGSGTVIIGDVAIGGASPVNPLSSSTVPYSGRFQLINQDTGKPVAGRRVKVRSSGGWSAFDTTDDEGMTSWVRHDAAETIYIDLIQGSER